MFVTGAEEVLRVWTLTSDDLSENCSGKPATTAMLAAVRWPEEVVGGLGLQALAVELAESSTCVVDGLWSDRVSRLLAGEAHRLAPSARLSRRVGHQLPGREASSLQYWLDEGPLLHALHWSPQLISLARHLTGQPVIPYQAAYLYYPTGGFCGLHTDRDEFELQMLVRLDGDVGPLVVYPGLSLALLDEEGEPADRCDRPGIPIDYPTCGVMVLLGSTIPHERPPHPGPEVGVVLGLNYRCAS